MCARTVVVLMARVFRSTRTRSGVFASWDQTTFTFAATLDPGSSFRENEENGNVGSLNGPQPIEIAVESSTLVSFVEMQVGQLSER